MLIDTGNYLYKALSSIINHLVKDYKYKLDVGCGECFHTRQFQGQNIIYLDIQNQPKAPLPFMKLDVMDFWSNYPVAKVDVLIALDLIEHLTKGEGFRFLMDAVKCNVKRVIIFSPEGDYVVESESTDPDKHRSGWTAQEFEDMGFQVILSPRFHGGSGAFLAWKTFIGEEYSTDEIQFVRSK